VGRHDGYACVPVLQPTVITYVPAIVLILIVLESSGLYMNFRPQCQTFFHLRPGAVLVMPVDNFKGRSQTQTVWIGNLGWLAGIIHVLPFQGWFIFKQPGFAPVDLVKSRQLVKVLYAFKPFPAPRLIQILSGNIELRLKGKKQFISALLTNFYGCVRIAFQKLIAVKNQQPVAAFELRTHPIEDIAPQPHTILAGFSFKGHDAVIFLTQCDHPFPGVVVTAVVQNKNSFAKLGES